MTTSTNMFDDYAHRGSRLSTMPFYVYRMYVRRVGDGKLSLEKMAAPNIFFFELHDALAQTCVQEVVPDNISALTIK